MLANAALRVGGTGTSSTSQRVWQCDGATECTARTGHQVLVPELELTAEEAAAEMEEVIRGTLAMSECSVVKLSKRKKRKKVLPRALVCIDNFLGVDVCTYQLCR